MNAYIKNLKTMAILHKFLILFLRRRIHLAKNLVIQTWIEDLGTKILI